MWPPRRAHRAGHPLLWDDGGVGSDGDLWKYWSDAVRDDDGGTAGGGGGAAAALLAGGGDRSREWEVVDGPEWLGPVWRCTRPSAAPRAAVAAGRL